jgi:ATP-binding cassette, subfamily C (CFTR/MRP), member 1
VSIEPLRIRKPRRLTKLITNFKDDHQERHSLLRACFRAYLLSFLSAVIPRLCLTGFTFAQPFLVNTTVTYVGQEVQDREYGNALIGGWVIVYLGIAVSETQCVLACQAQRY